MGVPQNGWFIPIYGKIPLKWMIWGYPHSRKPSLSQTKDIPSPMLHCRPVKHARLMWLLQQLRPPEELPQKSMDDLMIWGVAMTWEPDRTTLFFDLESSTI